MDQVSQRLNAMIQRPLTPLGSDANAPEAARLRQVENDTELHPGSSSRKGHSSKAPSILTHTTGGESSSGRDPEGASRSSEVQELKQYIDKALDTRLAALEHRLLDTLMMMNGSCGGSPSGNTRSSNRPNTSLALNRLPGAGGSGASDSADGGGPKLAMRTVSEEDGGGRGGSKEEEVVEMTESERGRAAQKAQRDQQQRERFMAKYSGKEIFGEKEDGKGGDKDASSPMAKTCIERARKEGVVIYPDGAFRTWWDGISIVLVCWIAIVLPVQLAFDLGAQPGLNVIDMLIDIFFLCDVCLNSITAYWHDGHFETGHGPILRRYVKTWFAFDLVSSFPLDWCFVFPPVIFEDPSAAAKSGDAAAAQYTQLVRIVRVVKLLRLLRIARLFRYLNKFEEQIPLIGAVSANFVRLTKLTFAMFLFCHWNGCFQFLLAQLDTPPYNASLPGGYGEGFPHGFHKDSWVVRLGIDDPQVTAPHQQWEWSVFTALNQMLAITLGSVEPERSIEVWGYMVSISLGAVLYAVFVAVLTAVVSDIDLSARAYRQKLDMVNQYMHHSHLPRELRAKLRTYYELCFPTKRSFDEDSILTEISRPLRQEVCLHKCRSVLAALQLLDDGKRRDASGKGLPGAISQELQRVVFVAGDYIIREGEETEGMFFVSAGMVELVKKIDPNAPTTVTAPERILTTLGAGALFGEMALLSQAGRAVASVRVKTFCEGYHLSKGSFNKLTSTYPVFKEYLESVARLRLQKNARAQGIASDNLQGMLEAANRQCMTPSMRKQSVLGRHLNKRAQSRVNKLVTTLNNSRNSTYGTSRRSMGCDVSEPEEPRRPVIGGIIGRKSTSDSCKRVQLDTVNDDDDEDGWGDNKSMEA